MYEDLCKPPSKEEEVPQRYLVPVPVSKRVAVELPYSIRPMEPALEQDLLSELAMLGIGFLVAPIISMIPEIGAAGATGETATTTLLPALAF